MSTARLGPALRGTAPVVLLSAVLIIACGGSTVPDLAADDGTLRQDLEHFARAIGERDVETIRASFAQQCRPEVYEVEESLARRDAHPELFSDLSQPPRARNVVILHQRGAEATVRPQMSSGGEIVYPLCALNTFVWEEGRWRRACDQPREITRFMQGERISIPADIITLGWSGDPPEGSLFLTIREIELFDEITPSYRDAVQPVGRFLLVYYDIENDLNLQVSPLAPVNFSFDVVDARGHRWSWDSNASTIIVDREILSPTIDLPPGFSASTIILYDVPRSATQLFLRSDDYAIEIQLDLTGGGDDGPS